MPEDVSCSLVESLYSAIGSPRGRPAPETMLMYIAMYSTATCTTYSHTCMANNTAVDLQYSESIMITGRSVANRYFVSHSSKNLE